MKRLFIIGASLLQLPAIKRAKELGYTVAVADYDPAAVGIPYADAYYNVSTNDPEGVCAAARAFGADGIMTLATDMPMRSVAYTCQQLGLVGIDCATALRATDKAEMIRAFEANGVACPWYRVVNSPAEVFDIAHKVAYPCITKPTDSSGSRGVMLAHGPEELITAVAYSAENGRGGAVIVEEYLQGQEVSVEAVVWQGETHILQITDKLTTGAPRFVEMGHTQPSRLDAAALESIRSLTCAAIRAVGIENGPAHVEIMVTEHGPKMVELGARMGGDCITTHLVPLSTGVDMIKATIDICMGETPDLTPRWDRGAAIRYLQVPCGLITAIDAEEARRLPHVQEVAFTAKVGDYAGGIYSSADRIGFVIADGETASAAEQACEAALHRVRVTTE